MVISTKWTEGERLHAVSIIAAEMAKAYTGGCVRNVDAGEWAERLDFVVNKSAEFLEANRRNILVKHFWKSDDQAG